VFGGYAHEAGTLPPVRPNLGQRAELTQTRTAYAPDADTGKQGAQSTRGSLTVILERWWQGLSYTVELAVRLLSFDMLAISRMR
jgi:hypothetical protein